MATVQAHAKGHAAWQSDTFARLKVDPTYHAFWLLRSAFVIAPIVFGLDKRVEAFLVEHSPVWLTELTTRY